jgi:hypothetical protein
VGVVTRIVTNRNWRKLRNELLDGYVEGINGILRDEVAEKDAADVVLVALQRLDALREHMQQLAEHEVN